MAVQIEQLDVVPAPTRSRDDDQHQPANTTDAKAAPQPQLGRQIAATLAQLRAREYRLHAD